MDALTRDVEFIAAITFHVATTRTVKNNPITAPGAFHILRFDLTATSQETLSSPKIENITGYSWPDGRVSSEGFFFLSRFFLPGRGQ
jgi:hypothetical protein